MNSDDPNKFSPRSWLIPGKSSSKPLWILLIAFLLTLIFHAVYIALFYFGWINLGNMQYSEKKKKEILYEITLNNELQDPRFIDTNPYLEAQKPPDTTNYAAKSQKAAQEIPTETAQKDIPTLDGDMEEILKIVPDVLTQTEEPVEIVEISPEPQLFETIPEEKEQKKLFVDSSGTRVRPRPKPRQRITKPLVGGMRRNSSAASNIGLTAVDARFNQFGVYRQKMHEAIGYQWYLLLSNYPATSKDSNSKVYIAYTIDTSGNVINLEVKEASGSTLFTMLCKDSVLSLGSFGPWNEDMLKILGKQQTFYVGFILR